MAGTMLVRLTHLAITLLALLVGFRSVAGNDLTKGLLLAVNSGEDTVALIDTEHPDAVQKIATRAHPQDVVISTDGSLAYVAEMGTANAPGNTVAVIDVRSRRLVRRFSLGRATRPHLLVLSHDGSMLWAACASENAVVEVDTGRESVRKMWDTKQKGSYLLAPAPDQKKLYVANFDAGSVSIIHRSDASVQFVPFSGQPIGIDVSPDGREVWISNLQRNSIAVIDTATDRIVKTFSSGGVGPVRLKFTPNGKQVWVTHLQSNDLVVFDVPQRHIIRRIPTGRGSKGLLVLPDSQHAFVSAMDDNRVVLVDVVAGKILQRIATGAAPEGLAWAGNLQ
jgi:YVTN family beta-propeller protein